MALSELRYAVGFSISAAVLTIGIKTAAYLMTDSMGLLSDALESLINFLTAITTYFTIWYSSRPADKNHTFGHEKIEYFTSGLVGVLIGVAGLGTMYYAVDRLIHPVPIQALDLGLMLALIAGGINLVAARILLRYGKRYSSPALIADGHHLMTDVLTSLGVVVGLILVWVTEVRSIDSVIALCVGANILITGFRLIFQAFNGLMDHALPPETCDSIRAMLRDKLPENTDFHALRTRHAGPRLFAEFHLLVPGRMSVADAHALTDQLEHMLGEAHPGLVVTIHIEPIEDEKSWETAELKQLGELPAP